MAGTAHSRRREQIEESPTAVRRTEKRGSSKTGAGGSQRPRPEGHTRELIGLALFGLAAFLVFVLVAGDSGGVIGRGAESALMYLLGAFAFLVPAGLFFTAAVLVFDLHPAWRSGWLVGGVLVLLGIVLLTASGFPPIGSGHPPETFVSEVYSARAGVIGEAAYATLSAIIGSVGVAIVSWLLLVAAAVLITGKTVRQMARDTQRAAVAVGDAAERTTVKIRRRLDPLDVEPGPLDDPYLSGFGPGSEGRERSVAEPVWMAEPVVKAVSSPESPGFTPRAAVKPRFRDGAAAFPDLFAHNALAEAEALVEGDPPQADESPHDAAPTAGAPVVEREPVAAPAQEPHGAARAPRASGGEQDKDEAVWSNPDAALLRKSTSRVDPNAKTDVEVSGVLVETLASFGVESRVIGTVVGPRVTRFELQLAPGTKVSKVAGLKDDLAYALATTEIRILAPIPGKSAVGVEVPNQRPDFVTLGDIYRDFPSGAGPLMVWLGKDISGKAVYTDLTKMPHLLIAGTTGSGKSGCINAIISSVLLRTTPSVLRTVLIDPKKVELSHYDHIPHLLVPVVTNMKNAAGVLHNLVGEMDNRYELMEMVKARHLDELNRTRAAAGDEPLPYILIVIDELADLMMVSPQEVEDYVIRIAQKARAVGIHLVVATQRPSADVITGMIKANIPSRIAFAVSSQTDSRVILDVNGAEALLGLGDMLFKPLGSSRLQRIQGAYVTEEEIQMLVTHWRRQAEPKFREELLQTPEEAVSSEAVFDPDSDDLLADAASLVIETGNASVSMLQRRLRVGYTRAGRLIDMLERRGIVGPYEGSKPRQLLVGLDEQDRVLETLRVETRQHGPLHLPLDVTDAEEVEAE